MRWSPAFVAAVSSLGAVAAAACTFELAEVAPADAGAQGADATTDGFVDTPSPDAARAEDAAVEAAPPCPDGGLDTNPRHCGRCGHDCVGGACEAGVCQPFVVDPAAASNALEAIAVRNGYVYYAGDQAVLRCPVGGCDAGTPIATGLSRASGLAVDDTYVYFATDGDRKVSRCPIAGCGGVAPTVLASTPPSPVAVVVDATRVYYGHRQGISACPLAGCGATAATEVSNVGNAQGIVLSQQTLFATSSGNPNAYACSVLGCVGSPTRIYAGNDSFAIAVVGSQAIFTRHRCLGTDPGTGACLQFRTSIETCPTSGCGGNGSSATQLVDDTGDIGPFGLAADATGTYYASGTRVRRVDAAKAVTDVFAGGTPRGVALDSDAVYWTDPNQNRVMGRGKP